jgi:DNA modification methylase
VNESPEKNHQNYSQITLLQGDALEILRTLPDQFVNAGITSPPYFGLRNYGIEGQLGLEERPEDYIANLVAVFQEFRRVLRRDGTLWLVIGDSYSRKNLLGIPWRLALSMQADGWILRQDIIWHKTNPLPNPAKGRCTSSHEYIFLLAKSEHYYFDYESIMEPAADPLLSRRKPRVFGAKNPVGTLRHDTGNTFTDNGRRRKRDVWSVPVNGKVKEAHFATFPPALIKPCIEAGCPEGGICLDMFAGSGTVGAMAFQLNRRAVLIELNPQYCDIIEKRLNCTREPDGFHQ